MPSRRPRSAMRRRSDGKARRIASRMAQPASTRSARSRPMQGLAARWSKCVPSSRSIRRVDVGVVHPQPVDAAAVVARQAEMDAGERRDRAGGAEQVEVRARRPPARRPGRSRARRSDTSSTIPSKTAGVTSTPPWRSASVTTPTGSESQARMRLHGSAGAGRRAVEPDDLGRAAADVEHDRPIAPRGSASAAQPVTARCASVAPVDDLEVEPELVLHAGEEGGAVVGEPAGLGGDQARPRRRAAPPSCPGRSAAPRACGRSRRRSGGRRAPAPRRAGRCAKRRR